MRLDTSTGGMLRTGQIPPLRLARQRAGSSGPTVKEEDLVLVLLDRQRMVIRAGLVALGCDPSTTALRNRTETESRTSRLSSLLALHENVARLLPFVWRDEEVMSKWKDRGHKVPA